MAKDPNDMTHIVKTYGPGFVARSIKSGRVVAHAKEFGKLWDQVKDKESFKKNELEIMHVPQYGIHSVY